MHAQLYELRPPGSMLALLLRAAVVDAGDSGPWLTMSRSADRKVTIHHIVMRGVSATPTRLPMLSGHDVIGYAHAHRWTPADVLAPSGRHLRALAVHSMLSTNARLWAEDYEKWTEWRLSPEEIARRDQLDELAELAVRSLRYSMAHQWLAAR